MRGEALREREEMVCRVNELQEELKVSQDAQVCFLVPGRSTGHVAGWLFLVQCRC